MKRVKILIVLIFLFISISAVSAEGNFTALQDDVDSSTDAMDINQDYVYDNLSDYKLNNGILINKSDFTINGNGHTIDGSNQARIFDISGNNITISNLIFINGSIDGNLGGALHSSGSITLNNVTFKNNNANCGGAISVSGQCIINNAIFTNNTASEDGGAIIAWDKLTINHATFTDNTASTSGGAIYATGKSTINNAIFAGNTASEEGGAIYWYGDNGTVNNCDFANNKATQRGGAIYWYGVNGTVSNSNFTNNTVKKYSGSAIQWDAHSVNGTINNCNFTNNSGAQKGGAIYWYGVNGTISNSNFINNIAIYGGAIYWEDNALNGALNNCSFISNAGNDGGAIYWYGANGRMNYCNFISNTGDIGGAVNWQRAYGLVNGCNFINNTAQSNGGALYWEGSNGTENNCNFTNNTAANGGAVYWYAYNGAVVNSKFTDNTATQNGGAVNWQGANGTVTTSNFINNIAQSNGGAIAISCDGAKIDNAKLSNNAAVKSGGAIYVDGKSAVISNSQLSGNSAVDGTDNVALGADGEYLLTDNVTSDKSPVISFVTEIDATSGGDVYQGGDPIVVNVKTNAKDGTASMTVDGKTYNGAVKDGAATISMPDLAAGTYSDVVVSYHDYDGNYGDASCNVTFTVKESEAKIINKDIKKDYNSNYKYQIRIIGVDGNPVNGLKVKISINGKVKTYKTGSKGYIAIKLDKTYTPGKYTVKLSYKGINSKHVITVKQILKGKKVVKIKKNAKKAVLKAELKSSKGKVIKAKKITFKVNGKTYKAKTNKKGIAEITLKNNVIKKFKAGKTYTVKITYLKDTIKTKLKVKR